MVILTKEDEDKIRSRLYKLGYLSEEVKLDSGTNYIVSGLERSGTSLMMQILAMAGVPMVYDSERLPDSNNPKGYYELYGGNIINKLMNGEEDLNEYGGKFVKITSYGLKYLPKPVFSKDGRKYKIIYMQRNLDEIIDSMEKMTKVNESNKKETRELLKKLDDYATELMDDESNISYLCINYNKLLKEPMPILLDICRFLGISESKAKRMLLAIDQNLYKERR